MSEFKKLNEFVEKDWEKQEMIDGIIPSAEREMQLLGDMPYSLKDEHEMQADYCGNIEYSQAYDECCDDYQPELQKRELPKVCPKCGLKYPEGKNFCPECLVSLKPATDDVDVKAIQIDSGFDFAGSSSYASFKELFSQDNLNLISRFDFTISDYDNIIRGIRMQSFENLDKAIRDNDIDIDRLEVLDKVILYAKSFTQVEFKSYGAELGYFEYDTIYLDDRQRKSLQITTVIHELTHFLIKEILTRVLCRILDVAKNPIIESFITYVLGASPLNRLVDEYAAHSVEGRFTIFGYQDYSSFISIHDQLDSQHREIAKTIGNTFSITVKDILEGFLDWDIREEIKDQFIADTIERPDYTQLRFESCNRLSDEGFLRAIWLILSEGFENPDYELLKQYEKEFLKD